MILAGSDPIGLEHLSFARPELARARAPRCPGRRPAGCRRFPPEGLSLEALERELILQALERAGGNKSQAARLLGLTRRTAVLTHGEARPPDRPGERRRGGGRRGRAARRAGGRARREARSMNLLRGLAVRQPRPQAGGAAAGAARLSQCLYRPAGDADRLVPAPDRRPRAIRSRSPGAGAARRCRPSSRGTGKQLIRLRLTEPPVRISLRRGRRRPLRARAHQRRPAAPRRTWRSRWNGLVSPRTVELQVDRKRSRRLPVAARVEGLPAGGVVWTGVLDVEPATVEVSGPEKEIAAARQRAARPGAALRQARHGAGCGRGGRAPRLVRDGARAGHGLGAASSPRRRAA